MRADFDAQAAILLGGRTDAEAASADRGLGAYGGRGWQKKLLPPCQPVPAIINAETGSIMNSIRTSLDLRASARAARNGHAGSRHGYFPVCGTPAQFVKDGKGKIKLLSPAQQAVDETLQAHKNVGDRIVGLGAGYRSSSESIAAS